jgi:hypothetical protein
MAVFTALKDRAAQRSSLARSFFEGIIPGRSLALKRRARIETGSTLSNGTNRTALSRPDLLIDPIFPVDNDTLLCILSILTCTAIS